MCCCCWFFLLLSFLNSYNCYHLFLVEDFSGRGPSFFKILLLSSLTSVLLLVLGCRPPASNKGWFMQMKRKRRCHRSLSLSLCRFEPLSISPDSHISSSAILNKDIYLFFLSKQEKTTTTGHSNWQRPHCTQRRTFFLEETRIWIWNNLRLTVTHTRKQYSLSWFFSHDSPPFFFAFVELANF